ncbi:protein serine/threonine kinase, putative [Entamoeba invadens IP1]|uniref:Protein serine/threonine kinase, putative n=1 Tax=Entamoeba invadens IP1 TaxID=370355 RepID=L7FMI1_ENTIV|nr:protein serine/threonine kinase, putative [Entamoeba invadens IP1]ELP89309.1 protein serine/threonine kinase, putative [Entamoeba invadens IP1]|eukprot:XP_004256080.1 protein serine/threonine kinase, putative [Entamoeba invadens IP1]
MAKNTGCAICRDGYYYHNKDCIKCDSSCSKCKNAISCDDCADDYYLYTPLNPLCQSYDTLIGCEHKTSRGCTVCEEGYFLDVPSPLCVKCPTNCKPCSSISQCIECQENNVLKNGECVLYTDIEFCTASKDSLCVKCENNKKPSNDGLSCIQNKLTEFKQIGIPIIVIIIVIVIVMITLFCVIIYVFNRHQDNKKTRDVCIFRMKKSNIDFVKLSKNILTNKTELVFSREIESGEIPVNEYTRELLCLGNNSNCNIKMQLKMQEENDVYEIQAVPPLITLKPNYACEFEISLKPNFTSKIEDNIACVTLNINEGTQEVIEIPIKATTVMSCRLDYHELIEENKINEGSFGIVYKGTFRGNVVCIKKMKDMLINKEAHEDEFEKEIQMLEKFSSEYIVHFYGAVFVPNEVCMVTEFAQYGSLNDLMKHKKSEEIEMKLRVKLLIDASKGILYLHNNGILHRDIKPDNILVFTLDTNEKVNAKLTDFGSSRNINLLMTNMTFTKGIGTPVYMAPEVLNQEKYKKSSDIYSFGITMYETFGWSEPYNKVDFKFLWNIAEFVISGKRLLKKGMYHSRRVRPEPTAIDLQCLTPTRNY